MAAATIRATVLGFVAGRREHLVSGSVLQKLVRRPVWQKLISGACCWSCREFCRHKIPRPACLSAGLDVDGVVAVGILSGAATICDRVFGHGTLPDQDSDGTGSKVGVGQRHEVKQISG
jgi:hypothetical protein